MRRPPPVSRPALRFWRGICGLILLVLFVTPILLHRHGWMLTGRRRPEQPPTLLPSQRPAAAEQLPHSGDAPRAPFPQPPTAAQRGEPSPPAAAPRPGGPPREAGGPSAPPRRRLPPPRRSAVLEAVKGGASRKYAFVSVISNEKYVDGAIVLAVSLLNTSYLLQEGLCELVLLCP
eukprot:EG_transcript_29666